MEFDHRDPYEKSGSIGKFIKNGSMRLLQEELDKCDLVCVICHRRRTARAFGWIDNRWRSLIVQRHTFMSEPTDRQLVSKTNQNSVRLRALMRRKGRTCIGYLSLGKTPRYILTCPNAPQGLGPIRSHKTNELRALLNCGTQREEQEGQLQVS